ncbi:MAG: helix-turn-helix domain-containing protein [Deltaproteobacteria bacterium]|jgi:transposase|nr:helix-turn-helix domain-containing protein [Deltaproteobacteria bacterium]
MKKNRVSCRVTDLEAVSMGARRVITLTPAERVELTNLTKTRKSDSRTALFARALLLSDRSPLGLGWSNKDIRVALGLSERVLERLKKRFLEGGLERAIERKPLETPQKDLKLDGVFEARLIALARSPAPEGRTRWTVRLLAAKAVELEYIDAVSAMSVQRILKKLNLDLTKGSSGKSR